MYDFKIKLKSYKFFQDFTKRNNKNQKIIYQFKLKNYKIFYYLSFRKYLFKIYSRLIILKKLSLNNYLPVGKLKGGYRGLQDGTEQMHVSRHVIR